MKTQQRPLVAVAAALLWAATASGAVQYCPETGICFSVAVPTSTAGAGAGNIYFSITAPASHQWVALGTGSQMAGSNIFVVYQDGAGNLTLSPRLGTAYSMPQLDTSSSAAQLTLLAGSGVALDSSGTSVMTAHVRCANCESWNGGAGQLAVSSTRAPWIAAWHKGSALATTSRSATISRHDTTAQFQLDLTKATVASDSNPFVESSGSGDSNSGDSNSGNSNSGDSNSGNSSSGDSTDADSGVAVSSPPSTAVFAAHAVIMSIVMVALYPLGSALMPLLGQWLLHGAWQGLAYLLMWAGFGLGVVAARQRGLLFTGAGTHHTVLGTVVVACFAVQPLLGLLHHRHFVRHGARGLVSHLHIWWGRFLMVLGVVNGGIGLQLSNAPHGIVVGYAVAAGVLFAAYVAAKLLGLLVLRRRRDQNQSQHRQSMPLGHAPPRQLRSNGGSSSTGSTGHEHYTPGKMAAVTTASQPDSALEMQEHGFLGPDTAAPLRS